MIRLLALLALPLLLTAEDRWVTIRSGPFQVFSNAGDKPAREQMEQLEQFRQGFGVVLGKQDLHLIWPLRLVIYKSPKTQTGGSEKFALARDAYFGSAASGSLLTAAQLRVLARLLLDQNTQRLPAEVENGLIELFSTLQVTGARITLGAPVPIAERTRDWARMHLLNVDPAYAGRARVMISNLEQGSELDAAYKNAFEKTRAQLEKQLDDYLSAGLFGTTSVSGRALNAARDFHVEQVGPDDAKLMLADVLLASGSPDAGAAYSALQGPAAVEGLGLVELKSDRESEARKLFETALNDRHPGARSFYEAGLLQPDDARATADLQKAADLNPFWPEPWYRMAQIQMDLDKRAAFQAKAAGLDPRNSGYWQALAKTYIAAKRFPDAQKAWDGAERAAATPEEREKIRAVRLQVQGERADFEAAERKRIADERAADLERVKNASMADIHAAEAAANKRLNPDGAAPPQPVGAWTEAVASARIEGNLQRWDCVAKQAKLVIAGPDGKTVQLLARDVSKILLVNDGEKAPACGVQQPARPVSVGYNPKIDKRLGTAGEVVSVEFR